MNCKNYKKLINLLIDGELEPLKEEQLSKHLQTCEECNLYYAQLIRLQKATKQDEKKLPENFSIGWKREIAKRKPKAASNRLKVLIPSLGAGVCGLIVLMALINPGTTFTSTRQSADDAMPQEAAAVAAVAYYDEAPVAEEAYYDEAPVAGGTYYDEAPVAEEAYYYEAPAAEEAYYYEAPVAEEADSEAPAAAPQTAGYHSENELPTYVLAEASREDLFEVAISMGAIIIEEAGYIILEADNNVLNNILEELGLAYLEEGTIIRIIFES